MHPHFSTFFGILENLQTVLLPSFLPHSLDLPTEHFPITVFTVTELTSVLFDLLAGCELLT